MSSNLLKTGFLQFKEEDTRVIDTNALVAKRLEALSASRPAFSAEDALFADRGQGETADITAQSNGNGEHLDKTKADAEAIRADAAAEADRILAGAKEQAQAVLAEAKEQAQQEKEHVLSQARKQGYEEGRKQAQAEAEQIRSQFFRKEKELEEEYQRQLEELEPQFIDAITGIYEHIFHVELASYREILVYLISSTMRKVEESRSFLIHVSREDYPYVSMQKKQIVSVAASANSIVEIVEDTTLSKNECFIETEGGIFDCGLGTQLKELEQRLKLLSYEK